MSQTDSITEGGLARPLFELAWPVVLLQLLQVTYNLADTLWLGRLSAEAVGAISLIFPAIFLLLAAGGGFSTAGSILVAQYTGADSEGSAGKVTAQTVLFVGSLGLLLGLFGYLAAADLLTLLPSDADTAASVMPLAIDYMEIVSLGIVFMFGFFAFSALMRGYGDTRTPMVVMFVTVVLNVALDPLLIFGWGPFPAMGIEGAAIATVISRGIATGIGMYVLFVSDLGPAADLAHLWPDFGYISDIVRVGVPSALEQSTSGIALAVVTVAVVAFSPSVVAAYGLGNRLISLVFLPAMGLGRAANTMVGQNLGADNPERAERATWLAAKVGASVLFVVAVVTVLFAEPIVRVFMATGTAEAAETIRHAADYMRIRSVEFTCVGVLQVLLGAFRGAGNTKTALGFSVLAMWLTRVPAVIALTMVVAIGPIGIWIGMSTGSAVGAVLASLWFTRGTWKVTVVEEESGSAGYPATADD